MNKIKVELEETVLDLMLEWIESDLQIFGNEALADPSEAGRITAALWVDRLSRAQNEIERAIELERRNSKP